MKLFIVLAALAVSAIAKPPRVIGGQDAKRDAYPYQISIQYRGSHLCGGSILKKNVIVTAGHCIIANDLTVRAGLLNQSDNKDVQSIKVQKAIVNPGFGGGVGPNDVAILILDGELEFNEHVQPIKLAESGKTYSGDVVLTGWGKTTNSIFDNGAETLQTVTLPLLTDDDCAKALANVMGTSEPFKPESNICTGPLSGGHSACNGDSGGPLVQDGALVGIVSWGMVPCATAGVPAIFTEVSQFVNFIEENSA